MLESKKRVRISLVAAIAAHSLSVTAYAQTAPETPPSPEAPPASDAPTPAPAPEKAVPAPNVDTNADGKPDAWDTDGDGKADAWDKDGDGKPDAKGSKPKL